MKLHPTTAALLEHILDGVSVQPHLTDAFANLAKLIAHDTTGPETTAALRKLLEARDCIGRATPRDA